jgi:hypothetical protein
MNMYNLKCSRGVVDFTEMFWSFSQKSVGSIVLRARITVIYHLYHTSISLVISASHSSGMINPLLTQQMLSGTDRPSPDHTSSSNLRHVSSPMHALRLQCLLTTQISPLVKTS